MSAFVDKAPSHVVLRSIPYINYDLISNGLSKYHVNLININIYISFDGYYFLEKFVINYFHTNNVRYHFTY